jgi:hypothetical protein
MAVINGAMDSRFDRGVESRDITAAGQNTNFHLLFSSYLSGKILSILTLIKVQGSSKKIVQTNVFARGKILRLHNNAAASRLVQGAPAREAQPTGGETDSSDERRYKVDTVQNLSGKS